MHQAPAQLALKRLATDDINFLAHVGNLVFHDNVKRNSNTHSQLNANLINRDTLASNPHPPIVSLIIPTNNEEFVIEALLKSLESLTYDPDMYEIIIVDDSTDSTAHILEQSKKRFENLKIVKRTERTGWKGGALNTALQYVREDSFWTIVLDADTILPPNIIEKFLKKVSESNEICVAVQGYCLPYNNGIHLGLESSNWVSKGVEFRLAQRNIIEFVAKNKLGLPMQLTGSLYMIRTSILKEYGFSTDVCEDWDLTLALYLRNSQSHPHDTGIIFDENLNAISQTPTSFASYFKQRMRVSEGHTRGFLKLVPKILGQRQSLKNKIEVSFTGLHYLKFTFIACLLLLDFGIVSLYGAGLIFFNAIAVISFLIQFICLLTMFAANVLGVVICGRSKKYTPTFLISKLALDICTFPAVVAGTFLGMSRTKGNFYRTKRLSRLVSGF